MVACERSPLAPRFKHPVGEGIVIVDVERELVTPEGELKPDFQHLRPLPAPSQ